MSILSDEQKEVIKQTVKGIMEEVRGDQVANQPVSSGREHRAFHVNKIENGYLIESYGNHDRRIYCETKDAVFNTIKEIL